jgi:hypothetical protein
MPASLTLAIPGVDRRVGAKLLTGEALVLAAPLAQDTGRKALANWATSPQNPYFSKNAVNRLWAHLCGRGLVEPVDDLTTSTSTVFAKLHDDLATGFAKTEFDFPRLAKAIVLSKPYQLGPSLAPKPRTPADDGPPTDEILFARTIVRPLSGEQLYDSLRTAAGWPLLREDLDGAEEWGHRKKFAETFRIEVVGAPQRSILQSLAMMNGPLTTRLSRIEHCPMLEGITQAPFLTLEGKIESLVLATLGRSPKPDETARFVAYVKAAPEDEPAWPLADLFWVLVNSVEFNTNH